MNENELQQVRRFNRTVTQRIGVFGDNYLGSGRPLGRSPAAVRSGSGQAPRCAICGPAWVWIRATSAGCYASWRRKSSRTSARGTGDCTWCDACRRRAGAGKTECGPVWIGAPGARLHLLVGVGALRWRQRLAGRRGSGCRADCSRCFRTRHPDDARRVRLRERGPAACGRCLKGQALHRSVTARGFDPGSSPSAEGAAAVAAAAGVDAERTATGLKPCLSDGAPRSTSGRGPGPGREPSARCGGPVGAASGDRPAPAGSPSAAPGHSAGWRRPWRCCSWTRTCNLAAARALYRSP
ncbi:hypothetical protein CDEF62S_00908 [Castellaniella defragrans]